MGLWNALRFNNEQLIVEGWTDLRLSTEINRPGMLTATIPLTEAQRQGLTTGLATVNKSVVYRAGKGGSTDWKGLVTQAAIRDGMLELTAEGPLAYLKKKLMAFGTIEEQPPGAILKQTLDHIRTLPNIKETLSYFTNAVAGEAGYIDTVNRRISFGATPAMDVFSELLPMLTDEVDMEIRADFGVVQYQNRVGRDVTSSVVLRNQQDGGTITSYSVTADLYSVTNYYRGIGLERRVTNRAGATGTQRSVATRQKPQGGLKATAAADNKVIEWVETNYGIVDATSSARFGPLVERRDYPNIRSKDRMERQLSYLISRTKDLLPEIEVTLYDPAFDPVYPYFTTGDTVTVAIGGGLTMPARVLARTLDVLRGTMTVALRGTTGI